MTVFSANINHPDITPILLYGWRDGYRLRQTWVFEWTADGAVWKIVVPAGFEYDGASVPRWLWSLVGIYPDGLHRAAALVHDWIYRHAGRLPLGSFTKDGEVVDVPWERHQADKLFANILAVSGVSKTRRRIMYLGVRAGGWCAWKNAK